MATSLPGSPHHYSSPFDAHTFEYRASAFTAITFQSPDHDGAVAVPISRPQFPKASHRFRDICVVVATVFAVISAVASTTGVVVGLVMVKSGKPDLGEEMIMIAAPICIITDLICAYFLMKCLLYRKKEPLLSSNDKEFG